MTPKLSNTDEVRKALRESGGCPVEVEDEQTQTVYVMLTREEFERQCQLEYDDSELTAEEMLDTARQALDDPEGWGAPGMEEYDAIDPDSPPT